MEKFILDSALITFLVCFVVDFSGVITSLKKLFWVLANGKIRYQDYNLPLIGCSLCSSFHIIWIYGLLLNIPILYSFSIAAAFSFSSGLVTKLLNFIFNVIYNLLSKKL